MFINEAKRKRARKETAQRLVFSVCAMIAMASLGVVTGILIAPMSGEETRAGLKKGAAKTVETVEKAVSEMTEDT